MLRVSNLTYRIEGRPLFEQASANIPTGHKVGLVGRNGTGKTTLFRLIRGEIDVDGGEIGLPRNYGASVAWRRKCREVRLPCSTPCSKLTSNGRR